MHIVVTGQIRHIATYRHLLNRIAEAQKAGAVQSATLVHWSGEEEVARELIGRARGDYELLVLEEPKQRSVGHFLHQALSLDEGLAGLAPDDIVLRVRPDVFGMAGFLEGIAGALEASAKPLWSAHADLTCPFFANDIVFGGRVSALRAQTNFSVEPFLTPIERSEDQTYFALSHEPEIQRWLHPWREDDWATRCYWRTFPNFGLARGRRAALLQRYHDWDFFETVRLGWLRRLVRDIALGVDDECPMFGLVRAASATAEQGKLVPCTKLNERERFDTEETIQAEGAEYVWTTSDRKAADFLAFCEARAPQPRALTPAQAHGELAAIWRDALLAPSRPALYLPVESMPITF